MQTKFYSLSMAYEARGAVVVVDVLRAFTTSAFAFSRGVKKIYPVSFVEDALICQSQFPGSLLMGEVEGYKPDFFDFGNSPTEILDRYLSQETIIHRTSAGTQGVVTSKNYRVLMASSFVVASATAHYLKDLDVMDVSFVITGQSKGRDGDEDLSCAEYIDALLRNENPDPQKYTSRILSSSVGRSYLGGEINHFSEKDLYLCSQVNLFNFAMVVNFEDNFLVMRAHHM